MRLIRSTDGDALAEVTAFVGRLGVGAGATSPSADSRTLALFGRPLSPAEVVERIVADVRRRGDEAVIDYVRKLDGADLTAAHLWVPAEAPAAAADRCPKPFLRALERAAANIRAFQEHILERERPPLRRGGLTLRERRLPVARVGVMVPSAAAPLPSSLLMCVVPAQVAGVREVIVASSPGADGEIRTEILAAARVCGVTRVLRAGGAQAVAALALGTASVPRVDKVVGPGNIFVTLAKRALFGEVGIDMLAGPSEVLIIADDTARPDAVAADLLAQAEHLPGAAILVTVSDRVAGETLAEVERQVVQLHRAEGTRRDLERFGLAVVARTLDEAVDLANAVAPEHLELQVAEPAALLSKIVNAGAVFAGPLTPTALGDYLAGPSHVLPTGGTARFSSGLSANDFLRRQSVIEATPEGLEAAADDVIALARAEGLDAHARSVEIRRGRAT